MSLVKVASTAMARYARGLPDDKIPDFGKKINSAMMDGKIKKKEFYISNLGWGSTQQADLVMLPGHGAAVRKHFYDRIPTPEALAEINKKHKVINDMGLDSFAKLYGYKNEGDVRRQKTYWEYVPGDEARSSAGVVRPERRLLQIKALERNRETARNVDARIANHKKMRRLYFDNPILSDKLKADIAKVRSHGIDLGDIATPNVIGGKVVDYETGISRSHYKTPTDIPQTRKLIFSDRGAKFKKVISQRKAWGKLRRLLKRV